MKSLGETNGQFSKCKARKCPPFRRNMVRSFLCREVGNRVRFRALMVDNSATWPQAAPNKGLHNPMSYHITLNAYPFTTESAYPCQALYESVFSQSLCCLLKHQLFWHSIFKNILKIWILASKSIRLSQSQEVYRSCEFIYLYLVRFVCMFVCLYSH